MKEQAMNKKTTNLKTENEKVMKNQESNTTDSPTSENVLSAMMQMRKELHELKWHLLNMFNSQSAMANLWSESLQTMCWVDDEQSLRQMCLDGKITKDVYFKINGTLTKMLETSYLVRDGIDHYVACRNPYMFGETNKIIGRLERTIDEVCAKNGGCND